MDAQNAPQQQTSQQPVTAPKQAHRSNMLLTVLVGLGMLGIGLGGGYLLFADKTHQLPTQNTPQVAQVSPTQIPQSAYPTSFENVAWQTYENKNIGFSVQHPPEWKVQETSDADGIKVEIKGAEGDLTVLWGSGLGGGCDEDQKQAIQIIDKQVSTCTGTSTQQKSTWSWYDSIYNKKGRGFSAHAYSPIDANSRVVKKVLSTLTITN